LLQGSKAVLEQFHRDGGSGQWGHRLDATAKRVSCLNPFGPCSGCIDTKSRRRSTKKGCQT
jgi:hypothetical protein